MNHQIERVMGGRVQMKELAGQHVGKPCQRVPTASKARGKSPGKTFPGQAPLNQTTLGDIQGIVIQDEPCGDQGPKSSGCDQDQQTADEKAEFHEGSRWSFRLLRRGQPRIERDVAGISRRIIWGLIFNNEKALFH